jgi:uncharacterized damage-inducible protein DinB
MIDELLNTLEYTVGFMVRSVDDLSEEEMVFQPPGVPNHATWTLGHLLLQVVVAHTAYHAGQLGMWRRALGKEPVAVFI